MRKPSLAAVGVLLLAAPIARAATVDREFQQSFDVVPGATLKLMHDDGDVEIRPWDQSRIDVHVRYHVVSRGIGTGPRDFEVDFDQNGDVVTVEGREIGDRTVMFGSIRTHEYRYTVRAPHWVRLVLAGDDGDVSIRDWNAAITVRGEDGDVEIDGLRGDLDVELDNGDLTLSSCQTPSASIRLEDGDLVLRGGSGDWSIVVDDGDLELLDLAATALEVRSEDGDVDVRLEPAGTLAADIRTQDGDVDLMLEPGVSATFSIDVDDGSIRLRASDLVSDDADSDHARGRIGDGTGGALRIRTQDGDVLLRDG